MQQALQQMRAALGPDAVIVASQETAKGVRLTAAAEGTGPVIDELLRPSEDDGLAQRLGAILERHGVLAGLRARLLAAAGDRGAAQPVLAGALRDVLPFLPPVDKDVAPSPVLLAGPPGAGKTTVAARLAACWLLAGHEVIVIAADRDRRGGVAQLAELLQPMGLQPVLVQDAAELVRLLRPDGSRRRVIVDLPAIDPFSGQDLARLADLGKLARGPATVVMPAGLDAADSAEMAQNLVALGCQRMIVTRLDAARRLGGLLAASAAGLAMADATASPLIGRGFLPLQPAGLARLLLAHGRTEGNTHGQVPEAGHRAA